MDSSSIGGGGDDPANLFSLIDRSNIRPASSPAPLALAHPRLSNKTSRPAITPVRFCLGFCALLALGVAVLVACFVVAVGTHLFSRLSTPHAGRHANSTLLAAGGMPESELVRSFFGPETAGARYDTFNVDAVLLARFDASAPSSAAVEDVAGAVETGGTTKEGGFAPANDTVRTTPRRGPYQEVYRSTIFKDLSVATKPVQTTVTVQFAPDIFAQLADPHTSPELVAAFLILPPSSAATEPAFLPTQRLSLRSALVSNGSSLVRPGRWLAPSPNEPTGALPAFLSLSASDMLPALQRMWPQDAADPISATTLRVATRSWVTMVRDFATYNQSLFEQGMDGVREHLMKDCSNGLDIFSLKCVRSFATHGHFDNVLKVEEEDGDARYWYSPFITASVGTVGRADLKLLNASDTDFAFDWRVTFSTSSPAKLGVLNSFPLPDPLGEGGLNATASQIADVQQAHEFWNALAGHHFTPGSRPVLRRALTTLGSWIAGACSILNLCFWLTRSLTTGISVQAQVLSYLYDWAFKTYIAYRTRNSSVKHSIGIQTPVSDIHLSWTLWGGSLIQFSPIVVILWLASRVEVGWRGWAPIGLGRRRLTHSERASARADALFTTPQRIVFFAIVWLIRTYGPSPPWFDLVGANSMFDGSLSARIPGFQVQPGDPAYIRTVLKLAHSTRQTFFIYVVAAQLLLNYRRKTYGAYFRLAAVLQFARTCLEVAPTVLHPWLGRPLTMQPLGVWGVFWIAMHGALAWQAVVYPAVPQEEPDDD